MLLHNFLNQGGADFDFDDWEVESEGPDEPLSNGDADPPGKTTGKQKRKEVEALARVFRDEGGSYRS